MLRFVQDSHNSTDIWCVSETHSDRTFSKHGFFSSWKWNKIFFNLSVLKLILYREDVWLLFTMQAVDLTHSHELIPPLRLRQTRKVWVCACTCIVCTQNIQYSSCVWVSVSVLQGATWLIPNKQDLKVIASVSLIAISSVSQSILTRCVCVINVGTTELHILHAIHTYWTDYVRTHGMCVVTSISVHELCMCTRSCWHICISNRRVYI